MPDLPSNLSILIYSVVTGVAAAVAGLAVATCVQIPGLTPNEAWATAVGCLSLSGGIAGVPVLRALDRRRWHAR